MKKDQPQQKPSTAPAKPTAADNRVAQRHQKRSQAGQLSAANVEESPHMDRGDSAGGAGQSRSEGQDSGQAAESLRRGALDTQYGTNSSMKSGQKAGQSGRVSSAGSGSSGGSAGSESSGGSEAEPQAPNPGSSEESSGAERDTMTGSRPGSGS